MLKRAYDLGATAFGYGIAASAWGVHLVLYPPVLAVAIVTRETFGGAIAQLHDEADRIAAEREQERAVAA